MTVRLADVGLTVDTECIGEDPSMITLTVIMLTNFIFGASNVGVLGNVGQIRACIKINNKGKSQYKSTLQH